MKKLSAILILASVFFLHARIHAQMAHVQMEGKITAENSQTSFIPEDFPVEVWCDGNLISTSFPDDQGNYKIQLNFGRKYRVRFGSNPWVVKMVDVNLYTPLFPAGNMAFTLHNDISLFKHSPTSDFEFLEDMPVAVADYDSESNCVTWNTIYNEKLTQSILNVLRSSNQLKSLP